MCICCGERVGESKNKNGDGTQKRSTEGGSKLKTSVDVTSSGMNDSTLEQMQVPYGTGTGVRRSKRKGGACKTN